MNFKHEILLNSFNRPHMIEETLTSIFNQRGVDNTDDVMIRILDDGSQEQVVGRIQRFMAEYSRFPWDLVLFQTSDEDRYKEARYAVCINEGLRQLLEEYKNQQNVVVHYLTDDSVWHSWKLARHDRFHKLSQIVYNNTLRFNVKLINDDVIKTGIAGVIKRPQQMPVGKEIEVLQMGPTCNFIDHISLSHKLSILNLIEEPWWNTEFKAWHNGDWLFWNKLAKLNLEFMHIDDFLDEKWWHDQCVQWVSNHETGLDSNSISVNKLRE